MAHAVKQANAWVLTQSQHAQGDLAHQKTQDIEKNILEQPAQQPEQPACQLIQHAVNLPLHAT